MRVLLPCAILLFAAPPLHAETYKWVDDKGVTNYSNTPPPAKVSKAKVIEERISIVPADPTLGAASAAMRTREARRAQYADEEWLLRLRLLAMQANAAYLECPYRADCGYGARAYPYYPAYFVVRSARPAAGVFPRPMPGPRGAMSTARLRTSSFR